MKRMVIGFIAICLLFSTVALAEQGKRGGGGKGGGSMDTLNEGIAYMNGDGVAQDYENAMTAFLSALEAGSMKAARYVGLMYEQGLGVAQDYAKAAEYYQQGVDAGDLTSGYYLALLYEQGLGVEQDYARAAELLSSVASSENKSATGVVAADCALGWLYEEGLGVEQDLEKAAALYREAAEYGYEDAEAALKRLEK